MIARTQLRSRAQLLREDEAGLSLVELLVSIVLVSIVLVMITGLFVNSTKAATQSRVMHESTQTAANISNEFARVVRMANPLGVNGSTTPTPPLRFAGTERLVLTALVDVVATADVKTVPAKPTGVEFRLDANRQVQERRWAPTASSGFWVFPDLLTTTPATTRTLGGRVVSGGTPPLFSYYDASGVELKPTGASSLLPADMAKVASITLTVRIQPQVGTGTPVVVQNDVELTNLGLKEQK